MPKRKAVKVIPKPIDPPCPELAPTIRKVGEALDMCREEVREALVSVPEASKELLRALTLVHNDLVQSKKWQEVALTHAERTAQTS